MKRRINHIKAMASKDVDSLVKDMGSCGFGARRLAEAVDVMEEMIKDERCTVFLGLAGALVPAGMKKLIMDMLDWVDVVVTTGANVTHDLIEAFGGEHLVGSESADDRKLHDEGIDRIYDVFMPNEVYGKLEKELWRIFEDLPKKEMSSREFLFELGKRMDGRESWVRKAAEKNVAVFCPAIADSGLGLQIWSWSLSKGKSERFTINTIKDLDEIIGIAWNEEKVNGAIILGGGVPKNFILQAMQFIPSSHKYAVQVTMDRAEPGGLSGASLREGISWGKLSKDARYVDVIADVTIVLPFMVSVLKRRINP